MSKVATMRNISQNQGVDGGSGAVRFEHEFTSPEQEANHLIGRYQESFDKSKWVSADDALGILREYMKKFEVTNV